MIEPPDEAREATPRGPSPPSGDSGSPALPLSARAAKTCDAAFAALGSPGRSGAPPPRGRLPRVVAQTLRMLCDGEFHETAQLVRSHRAGGEAGPGLRDRRRALLGNLQRRHPEAVAAIRAAHGPRRPLERENFIIVSVYTHLIIITSGELRCLENLFDEGDPEA